MAEFRANGRDSPLDGPPASAPAGSVLPQLCRQPPPSPAEWERRGILWSRHWRCYPDAPTSRDTSDTYTSGSRDTSVTYTSGSRDTSGTYTNGSRDTSATDGATERVCVYHTEWPFGGMFVLESRAASGGGGSPSPPEDPRDSPLQRPPRAGRAAARKRTKQPNHCVFCKNNNELPCVYRSHILKDNQGRISCPILRVYTCPTCGANGDGAHTVKYCPQRQADQGQRVEVPPPRPAGRPITKRGCH